MGLRGLKGGFEIETLSTKSRRMSKFRPGVVRAAKRGFSKRMRKQARQEAKSARVFLDA
jgi:hypothetical protein